MVLTTRQFTSQQYDASSIKGQGPIVLARAAACQVVGLLIQLGELSQFALDIFQALGYETHRAATRIDAVSARTTTIEETLAIYSQEIEEAPPSSYFHNGGELNWKRDDRMTNNLFSPASRSVPLSKLVNTTFAPPNIALMNELSGKDCTILYSDPAFFFKHWAIEEERKLALQREEKKKQRQGRPRRDRAKREKKIEVQAIEVKVYNTLGKEFGGVTTTTTAGSSSLTAHSVAAPRPIQVSPQQPQLNIQRTESSSGFANDVYTQEDSFSVPKQDYYHEESFNHQSYTHQQPIAAPKMPKPVVPAAADSTNLDDILAAKITTAGKSRLPPPPRAPVTTPVAHSPAAPTPVASPKPPQPSYDDYSNNDYDAYPQPPTPHQPQPPTPHQPSPPQPHQPSPPQQQYHHIQPPSQPEPPTPHFSPPAMPPTPQHITPPPSMPSMPPTPQHHIASPPVSPPTSPAAAMARPVNPAAAAIALANKGGAAPALQPPKPVDPSSAPPANKPPHNALMGALRGGIQLKSAAAAQAADPAPPTRGGGLLADIKSRPMLRKASVLPGQAPTTPMGAKAAPVQSAPAGLSAVMDILARRGAIADDTESDDDSDSDWD